MSGRAPSPSLSALPPIPYSPTASQTSTAFPSIYNLPLPAPPPSQYHYILDAASLEASQNAYSNLLQSAKAYRLALAALSESAGKFGGALETCARLKEARNEALEDRSPVNTRSLRHTDAPSSKHHSNFTANNLLVASGVHQLIANHQQILSETVYKNFEVPLLHELEQWQRQIEFKEESYKRQSKTMSKEIRRMEKTSLKLRKTQKRELSNFRGHLVSLMGKIDALTNLSEEHGKAMVRHSQAMSQAIVECSAGIVRAEVDIFEALARKGNHGGGLDELLEKGHDFFTETHNIPHNTEAESNDIFTNLPTPTAPSHCIDQPVISEHNPIFPNTFPLREDEETAMPVVGIMQSPENLPTVSERDSEPTTSNQLCPIRPPSPIQANDTEIRDPIESVQGPENIPEGRKNSSARIPTISIVSQGLGLIEACQDDQDYPTNTLPPGDDDMLSLYTNERTCNVI